MRWTILLPVLALGALPGGALADEPRVAAPPPVSGPGCMVKGTWPIPKGTAIHDAPAGGRTIATFTGAHQALVLSDFPADPTTGRARAVTSLGSGLRIEGWASTAGVPVFTVRELAVAPGHVWIADAQRVRLVAAASGALTAELTVPGSNGQTVRASAPCDAFSLQAGTPTAATVPGDARGYLSRTSALELFEEPGGAAVITLHSAEGAAQLFWSNEARGGFVRVRTRGGLVIDAWARVRDLEPLKKGEMMDQFVPPTTAVAAASLKLDGEPRLVKATRDIVVRARREEKDRPIGVVEAGAEIYVLETMLGFTNVLPKNLGLTPGDDGGFWIPSADVPKP